MRVVLLFLIVMFLSSCQTTSQSNSLYWHHTPFVENPKVSLAQAQAICRSMAENSALAAPQGQAPRSVNCDTSGYTIFGTNYTGSTTCQQVSNPFAELAVQSQNRRIRESAANNSYKSCMAQHDWNAQLTSSSRYGAKANDPKQSTQYRTCVAETGNAEKKCRYPDGLVEVKPTCTCSLIVHGTVL